MKRFKNLNKVSPGFSFMEIMIAILMLGMMMTAILSLQNTTFKSVVDLSGRLSHIFTLRNRFVTAALERIQQSEQAENKADQIKENNLEAKQEIVTHTLEKINEKSALKKFEYTMIQKGRIEWQHKGIKHQETMISFLYKAPKPEEQTP